jgi:hypothetical protein
MNKGPSHAVMLEHKHRHFQHGALTLSGQAPWDHMSSR